MKYKNINNSIETSLYNEKDYISLYTTNESSIFNFTYKEGSSFFKNTSIKKKITHIGSTVLKKDYYDLETAYAYGGFYTNSDDPTFMERAFSKYKKRMKEENIIAEFLRFHPFNPFPKKYYKNFDFFNYDRDTVIIDLTKNYNYVTENYSYSLKRNIKKAKNNFLRYEQLIKNNENIKLFYNLYYQTMYKNNANKFYFFSLEYFKKLFQLPTISLHGVYYKSKIINMIILIEDKMVLHYHLGATNPDYYSLNTNPFLFDEIIKNNIDKFNYFYLGGGRSSSDKDSLYKFKKKFSSQTMPFYIAGNIYNNDIFTEYNNIWKQQNNDINYFLKYRIET